jgi:hypothetical protein
MVGLLLMAIGTGGMKPCVVWLIIMNVKCVQVEQRIQLMHFYWMGINRHRLGESNSSFHNKRDKWSNFSQSSFLLWLLEIWFQLVSLLIVVSNRMKCEEICAFIGNRTLLYQVCYILSSDNSCVPKRCTLLWCRQLLSPCIWSSGFNYGTRSR